MNTRPEMIEQPVVVAEELVPVPAEPTCKQSFSNFCDPGFFKSVMSVGEIVQPITPKKVMWWAAAATALGGVIAIEATTGAFSTAANYANYGLMAFLYAVDPTVQLLNVITAKYPPALGEEPVPEPTPIEEMKPSEACSPPEFIAFDMTENNDDIAVVIPCHLAADQIEETIRSCLRHVKPEQIYIIDNGNSDTPLDNTEEIVKKIDPRINYMWGHIGNKTFAQYIGTLVASKYKYIFTMDDDMRLPKDFSFGKYLFDEKTKAVCYPIRAVHPVTGETNTLVRWQDLEYKLAGCAKLSQDRFDGVKFPHGAASMWDREVFLEVLRLHDAIFWAEDVKLGMILTKLGYRMSIAAGACLDTVVPKSLFGEYPNLYQQRVRSWEFGRQLYFLRFLSKLFLEKPLSWNPVDIFMSKFSDFYAVYTNIVDWIRLPVFLLMARNPDYWIRFAAFNAASVVPLLLWNYVKLPLSHRKDLQSGLLDILSYPAFKLIESIMSIGGIARLLGVYIGNYVHKPNVVEYEQSIIGDLNKLRAEVERINRLDLMPRHTYKNEMYGRFFSNAYDPDGLDQYNYCDFVIDEPSVATQGMFAAPAAVTQAVDPIAEQFENTAVYVDMIPAPSK